MWASNNKQTVAFTLLCVTAPMAFVMYALTGYVKATEMQQSKQPIEQRESVKKDKL